MVSRHVTANLLRDPRHIDTAAEDREDYPEVHDEMIVVQRRHYSRRASNEAAIRREISLKPSIEPKLVHHSVNTCFAALCIESDDEVSLNSDHHDVKEEASPSKEHDVSCHQIQRVSGALTKKRKSKKRSVTSKALTPQNHFEEPEEETFAEVSALRANSHARDDRNARGDLLQIVNEDALRKSSDHGSALRGALKNQKGVHADVVPAATMAFAAELVALATGVLRQNADIPVAAPASSRRNQFQQHFAAPRSFTKSSFGGGKRPVTRQTLTRMKGRK